MIRDDIFEGPFSWDQKDKEKWSHLMRRACTCVDMSITGNAESNSRYDWWVNWGLALDGELLETTVSLGFKHNLDSDHFFFILTNMCQSIWSGPFGPRGITCFMCRKPSILVFSSMSGICDDPAKTMTLKTQRRKMFLVHAELRIKEQ